MGTILRAILIYWFLLVVLRIVGRRSFEQMTPFEMILVFLLGGLGIQCIVYDDHSLVNALLGITTIALMHVLVSVLKMYSEGFRKFVDGTPIVIVEDDYWHEDRMHKLRLQMQDIMAAAREDGPERMDQIRFAVVERNGSLSIVRKETQ
jgi:uncharacterized membrane protein YcaP (DUF421 family)